MTSLASIVTYPWTLIGFQLLILSLAGFTQQHSSLRISEIALMTGVGVAVFSNLHHGMENRGWKTLPAALAISIPLTAIAQLINDRISYNDGRSEACLLKNSRASEYGDKVSASGAFGPKQSRFWFAVEQAISRRRIGTPLQLKAVPPFSTQDPDYVPSRASFLIGTIASLFCCYIIWDVGATQAPPDPVLIAPNKQAILSRLGEVTLEELMFRTALTVGYYIQLIAVLKVFPGVFGLVAVASGLSDPAAWPPAYGSLSELYSIRQFWGIFWHQYLRVTLEGCASLVVRSLHIPKGTLIYRYTHIFLCFLVSGLIHIGADWGETIPLGESGALYFFLTQAFGIMLEDAFQAAYYHFSGKQRKKEPPKMHKIVGFVWLAVFLTWSSPVWLYPQIRHIRLGPDNFWPFSLIKYAQRPRGVAQR